VKTFWKPIAELQPSQLFISADKLARVQASFDPGRRETMEPVPVKELDGRLVLMDGHTRTLAALLAGWHEMPIVWDEDELDMDAYRICVSWCLDERIESVHGLRDRILSTAQYNMLWLARCRQMQAQLADRRRSKR
jgi:hypothetical protein